MAMPGPDPIPQPILGDEVMPPLEDTDDDEDAEEAEDSVDGDGGPDGDGDSDGEYDDTGDDGDDAAGGAGGAMHEQRYPQRERRAPARYQPHAYSYAAGELSDEPRTLIIICTHSSMSSMIIQYVITLVLITHFAFRCVFLSHYQRSPPATSAAGVPCPAAPASDQPHPGPSSPAAISFRGTVVSGAHSPRGHARLEGTLALCSDCALSPCIINTLESKTSIIRPILFVLNHDITVGYIGQG